MGIRTLSLLFCCLSLHVLTSVSADWSILNQNAKNGYNITLKNYCESWKMNVELHNIRDFEVVPDECVGYIGKYVRSTQYKVDLERSIQECIVYLSTSYNFSNDGRDAWIFDIDDTLLSTVPYFKKHHYGGEKLNLTDLEKWTKRKKAPALESSLRLFNDVKDRGLKIILVSSRREHLRSATIHNLVKVGYFGWTGLILRRPRDEWKEVQHYKADVRKRLIRRGYRIWGVVGDQYSSIEGLPAPKRTFKLPNPMYSAMIERSYGLNGALVPSSLGKLKIICFILYVLYTAYFI